MMDNELRELIERNAEKCFGGKLNACMKHYVGVKGGQMWDRELHGEVYLTADGVMAMLDFVRESDNPQLKRQVFFIVGNYLDGFKDNLGTVILKAIDQLSKKSI